MVKSKHYNTSRATGGSGQQERTPLSTRKRPARLIHKKTGLKKQKTDNQSQSTDVTVTTVGSLASLPSSISQSSPARDILSPSSSSSRQSVTDEIKGRLSGKRLSIEQSLPDTLPLPQSDEDHYQRVTIVIEKVERVFREITTTKKVVGPDGAVIESSQDVKRLDPVIVEESTHKKVQYIYIPSPSRSVTSMTSGDLADISSSISKSSGSLGSKVSLTSSSLDHSDGGQSVSKHLQTQSSVETSQQAAKPVRRQHSMDSQKKGSSGQSDSDKMEAPKAVPRNVRTQSGSNLAAKPPLQPPTGHTPKTRLSVQTSGTSGLGTAAPESPTVTRPKSATPGHSDHDVSGVVTPLGSTINGSGNYLHSRTVSMESPRMSSSLFSSSDSAGQQRNEQVPASKTTEIVTESSSSDHLHPEQKRASSPQQDQAVSSSNTPPDVAMVTSSGAPGSRVLAKWKDGFYYPGVLRTSPDRLSKCSVRFDDGDSMHVKISDILLIGRLPAGQSVMVLTEDGDFEFGLVLQQTVDRYVVETDEGKNASYSFSQVILSSDQAACIISDHGPEVQLQGCTTSHSSTGNMNQEDLPRSCLLINSRKLLPGREQRMREGGRGRSRKRKLEPQATSTPTPKGKAEPGASKRQRVQDPSSSPVRGIQDSPAGARKSPRKPRVELFTSDLGPLPTRKLFRGLNFLLTNVEKTQGQRQEERQLLKNPLDTSTDDSSNDDENGPLFNKDHLKAQIEAGGGAVNSDKKIILLSSAYQRTIKYLKCLATGISCVSYMWVVDSCTQGALLDQVSYVLPAGISLEKKKIIERKKKDIFLNMKAVVCSKKPKFTESWTNILQLAKCQVVNKLQNGVNFLLTDQSCSATMERQARNHSVALVSTEWLFTVDCIGSLKNVFYCFYIDQNGSLKNKILNHMFV
ncbi:TP53B-like protein [Mya arenaria]|uniref:TP53B-like protein n=1 Tax=Mya arenaria TaxID=6604 RepID=A0ABY7DU35_MYAAR|nr:TP53B-like protein [Mya arenaria]